MNERVVDRELLSPARNHVGVMSGKQRKIIVLISVLCIPDHGSMKGPRLYYLRASMSSNTVPILHVVRADSPSDTTLLNRVKYLLLCCRLTPLDLRERA